jgi:DNA-binding response OmpR family regulator
MVSDSASDCAAALRLLRSGAGLVVRGPVGAVEALRQCTTEPPAALLVNAEIRDISGPELCRLIRGRFQTARLPTVLFDSREGRPPHLDAAIDRYLPAHELGDIVRHVHELLRARRRGDADDDEAMVAHYHGRHLVASFERVSIEVDGNRVDLTRRELRLLQFLVAHPNRALT